MDAHKLWMLRDFIGTNKVLFRIPVYQRNYDWARTMFIWKPISPHGRVFGLSKA